MKKKIKNYINKLKVAYNEKLSLKTKTIRRIKKRAKEDLKAIKVLDKRFVSLFTYISVYIDIPHMSITVNSLKEMYEHLSKARKFYPFELSGYNVPYKGELDVKFKSPVCIIRYDIKGDEEELLNEISKGKCKIVESEYKYQTVQCEVK